jgi:hypothetical protein
MPMHFSLIANKILFVLCGVLFLYKFATEYNLQMIWQVSIM